MMEEINKGLPATIIKTTLEIILLIYRALIKYGYSNFRLEILESRLLITEWFSDTVFILPPPKGSKRNA